MKNVAISDSSSSEYSVEYQNEEEYNVNPGQKRPNYRQHFRDVEAQNQYDPASLQQFASTSDNEYDEVSNNINLMIFAKFLNVSFCCRTPQLHI